MVEMKSSQFVDSSLLAFRLTPFQDEEGFGRHLLTCRLSGAPRIAASLYESYLALKTDSHKGRSATLYGLATLYSWAESVAVQLDALLVGGQGLIASEVSAFSMWLRSRLGHGSPERLSPQARHNHNQILHFCRQACIYFIIQYGSVDRTVGRVRQIELLVRAQERLWHRQRIKQRKLGVASDMSDDELRRIEAFLLPENRASSVGEAIANRNYLIWRLTIEFGLRIGEILSLRLQDCPAPGRDFLSVVRIEERTDGVVDARGANAPRPKTLSRDLHPLWAGSNIFRLISSYSSRFRRGWVKEHERYVFRWVLPHPFLIVSTKGNPLSLSATQDVASAIKDGTGIDFNWHLGRHAFFNRMYQLAKTNQEQQDLVYWGGWESEKSLLIYSRKARADRARGVMRAENEKWTWMQLS
jgi:integrase